MNAGYSRASKYKILDAWQKLRKEGNKNLRTYFRASNCLAVRIKDCSLSFPGRVRSVYSLGPRTSIRQVQSSG